MMNFRLLSDRLQERDFSNPSLNFLMQDNSLYNLLLFQPRENVVINDNSIRVENRDRTIQKFNGFFRIATEQNIDIAVTPEYSCPWDVIDGIINQGLFPHENNMWIIGCESILPAELSDYISKHEEIEWIYEEQLLRANHPENSFLNPVIYFFNVRDDSQEIRRICLVQFKTCPLGGSDWEQQNLITGNDIYIIENEGESIKLFTLICSDVLHTNILNRLPNGYLTDPYLIVHIQFNSRPDHHDFSTYRQSIFRQMNNKEVISLNWGRGVELVNLQQNNRYGGSAIYLKSNELNLTDERISDNHKLGLYYTYWKNRRSSIYFFNYDEYIFRLRNTKPSQAGMLGVNQARIGPQILEVNHWNDNWEIAEEIEDGFCPLCEGIENIENNEPISLEIFKNEELFSLDIERLISLSAGEIGEKDWHSVKKMKSFIVEDTECIKRITFTHHPDEDTRIKRRGYLRRFAVLYNVIIKGEDNFPESISDLKNNCTINYRPTGYENEYNLNLFPNNDSAPASIAYLSEEYDETDALSLRDKMMDLFEDNQFEKRIVVWLRTLQGAFSIYSSDKKPSLKDNPSKSKRSIKKTE